MISHISIKDFAIIENAEIDFYDGLNMITGETGSGKSIVIEAVSLALGSRADTAFIRSGKSKATVQLVCDYKGEEYIITREISAAGKNLCKLNGEIITLAQLNETCKKLADIHGQYDHQSLLNADHHIKLIDSYQKERILPAKQAVEEAYGRYKEVSSELNELLSSEQENQRQLDFMSFEAEEIRKAALTPGEDEQLEEEISVLQNSEKIYEGLMLCHGLTSGNDDTAEFDSALSLLTRGAAALGEISSYSKELQEIEEEYSNIFYRLEDLASQIRQLQERTVYSPDDLNRAITRAELIDKLKQKYGNSIEEIIDYGINIEKKLDFIDNIDQRKEELEKELSHCESALKNACKTLSEARKAAAEILEQKIQKELTDLNFKDALFRISFSEESTYTENGSDKVEFLISTNKGEALKPLSKIASGGEMSRIMLAFKKIIGDYDEIPTMIFDEIDSGISGVTASVVGKSLLDIAKNHQIICITHLPQIAAFGQNNYKISKSSDDDMTYTTVVHLSEEEKVQEIARLVGGLNVTTKAIENAKELIEQSK